MKTETAIEQRSDSRSRIGRHNGWIDRILASNVRMRAAAFALALALLAVAAWMTSKGIDASAQAARTTALLAMLDARLGALRAWPVPEFPPAMPQADAMLERLLSPPGKAGDGATADVYAFDQRGVALTGGRYGVTMRSLRPEQDQVTTAGFRLRDPGRDLRQVNPYPSDLQDQPLTLLIERALSARIGADGGGTIALRGVLVEPYRNHIGRQSVGAWQWLPQHNLGIAVEVAPQEIFPPLRYLAVTVEVIYVMLFIAVMAALAAAFSLADVRRGRRRLGPYHLGDVIEEGGMATVHHAEHALLKRPTAVKILKPHLATDELIARFEREVMLTSRLQHPATVEIYDYGRTPEGTFYFAMEYIDGLTLARLVERDGTQPVARVSHILKQVCESLREAHGKGLVHRDMKPPNIMVCERGGESDVVKVLDWGLIKDVRATEARDITLHMRILGTPVYMPPERVRNPAQADPQVDIYGLGAVAYFLLTGRLLFDAPNQFDLQKMVVEDAAPRASRHATQPVPAALDDLIARCLAKDPAARPRSVAELIAVFTDILRSDPWTPEQAAAWWQRHRAGETRSDSVTRDSIAPASPRAAFGVTTTGASA